MISFSHNIERLVHSYGEVSQFNKWLTNWQEMFLILAKVVKCLCIMAQKSIILLQYHLHYAHRFHKLQELVINIELKVKIVLLWLTSEKVLQVKEISMLLSILLLHLDVKLCSFAETICTQSLLQSMINMQVMVS